MPTPWGTGIKSPGYLDHPSSVTDAEKVRRYDLLIEAGDKLEAENERLKQRIEELEAGASLLPMGW